MAGKRLWQHPVQPKVPESYEWVKTFKGGSRGGAELCRLKSTGQLVVLKSFDGGGGSWDIWPRTDQEPPDYELYYDLPLHDGVVKVLDSYKHFPVEDMFVHILPFFNAGTMDNLQRHVRKHNVQVPEAFLWSIVSSVLEALQACLEVDICHGDLHLGNIVFHFDEPISVQFPRPVLIDFGDDAFCGDEEGTRYDIARFFTGIWLLMYGAQGPQQTSTCPYSRCLIEWVALCSGLSSGGFLPPSLPEIMENLHHRIPRYIRDCKGEKTLPKWLHDYFMELQENSTGKPTPASNLELGKLSVLDFKPGEGDPAKVGHRLEGSDNQQGAPPPKRRRLRSSAQKDPQLMNIQVDHHSATNGTQPSSSSRSLSPCFGLVDPSPFQMKGRGRHHCEICAANINLRMLPAKLYEHGFEAINLQDYKLRPDFATQTKDLIPALEEYYSIVPELGIKNRSLRMCSDKRERDQFRNRLLRIHSKADAELVRILENRKAGNGKDRDWLEVLWHTDTVKETMKRLSELEEEDKLGKRKPKTTARLAT